METFIAWMRSVTFVICGFVLTVNYIPAMAQSGFQTKNNYTGEWTDAASWVGSYPGTTGIESNVTIWGEITSNTSIEINKGLLVVSDTLLIHGDLTLGNNADLSIGDGGVLIVYGSVTVANKVDVAAGGTIIVEQNLTFQGSGNQGSFTSTLDPAQVYVGGTVTLPANVNYNDFPVLKCDTGDHESTNCSYGNLTDLQDSGNSVVDLYCGSGISGGTIASDQTVCSGQDVAGFTNVAAGSSGSNFTYQWLLSTDSNDPNSGTWNTIDGATDIIYDHGTVNQQTHFYRKAMHGNGCSAVSNVVTVVTVAPPNPIGIFYE